MGLLFNTPAAPPHILSLPPYLSFHFILFYFMDIQILFIMKVKIFVLPTVVYIIFVPLKTIQPHAHGFA